MPMARRIKSKHEMGDVLVDFADEGAIKNMPDEIKQVLMDMTLGGTDQLHLWEVEKCAEILERIKTACAPSGDGKPSYEQCDEGVDLLMKLMQAKNSNQADMVYTHLPEQLQSVFKCWDLSGSGSVSATDLHAAAGAWTKMHEEKQLLKRLLFGAVLLVLALFCGIFVLGLVTAELSKEFKANSGTMVDSTGRTVRVANSGFDVSKDGSLKVVEADGAGRLGADDETPLVSTQTARKEKSLHSALADSYFDALDELSVHSEKGHKLNLKIHGFARVPVLGARCGNVVYLFSTMDGHITLDSTDLSFDGHLAKLFENAGFAVAVGGAAGRRLESVKSVQGFFNQVAGVAAGWKCEGVPLPKMPKMSTSSVVVYAPCSVDYATRKRRSCDSSYGGQVVGVVAVPSQHLDAVSSRLDNVRRDLGAKVQARQVLYSTLTQTVMRSPSYQVQFDHMPNHPKQERVIAVNTVKKEGVRFNRLTSSSARTLCEETDMSKDPAQKVADAKSGVNVSLHLEFVGIVGEGGGTVYRRWRVMPADGFRKWMLGEAKPSKDYYEYWDDAQTFAPHRILDSMGRLSTFIRSKEGTSDADIEAALGASSDDEAQTGAAHRFSCDADEKDAFHPSAGAVPGIHSPFLDLGAAELNFYVQELAADIASWAASTAGKANNGGEADGSPADSSPAEFVNETDEKLVDAWAEMKSVTEDDELFAFATYALRSKNLFAMPDACADVCSASLADAKRVVGNEGENEDVMCVNSAFTKLVDCLNGLQPPLLNSCQQNRFQATMMEKCQVLGSSKPELPADEVSVLPDGTHAIDAASLGVKGAETLGGAFGSDARLLVNASETGDAVVVEAGDTTRRLTDVFGWCGDWIQPICFQINFPLGCKSPGESEVRRLDSRRLKSKSCKFYLKVAISLPGREQVKPISFVCAQGQGGPPRTYDLFNKNHPGWCTCEGVVYYGNKYARGNRGRQLQFHSLKYHRAHKSKSMSSTVWCSPEFMGGDPSRGYTKQCWCEGSASISTFWGLTVELGGSINVLDKVFGIPNPPVYGEVFAGGGITVSSSPACPKHGIKFSIEGWALIGAKAGVNLVFCQIDNIKIELKIGAKLTLVKAYTSKKDISRRRRRWGSLSRRRRAQWQSRQHAEICDVVVYAKFTLTYVIVRGWILGEYFIRSKRFMVTIGFDWYNLFACWGGDWQNALTFVILDSTM